MHVYITARHFSLTDQIREHVERRIVDAVRAHADAHDLNRIEVQLEMGQREARFSCHVMVQLPEHHDVNITEQNHDLYAAIDLVEKRLIHAVSAERERRLKTSRRSRAADWR